MNEVVEDGNHVAHLLVHVFIAVGDIEDRIDFSGGSEIRREVDAVHALVAEMFAFDELVF
jgi:hypothetical protein